MLNKRIFIYVGNMKTGSLLRPVCTLIITHTNITARTIASCIAIYGQIQFSFPDIESEKGDVYWVPLLHVKISTTTFSWPRELILIA